MWEESDYMGQAIGDMLPAAIGVAISPMPIVAVVLMLVSARGRVNGPSFLVGWWAGIAIVGTVVLVVAGSAGTGSSAQPATWVGTLQLILGILLLLVAVRQWRGRPREGEESPQPKWMGALDRFGPLKAAGAGLLLSAVNPKNLLLVVAGATAIAQAGLSGGGEAVALVIFILIASIGVGAPVVLYFAAGKNSRQRLDSLKGWMARNNSIIMAVLLLVIGVKLLGNGISTLSM
jgi:threonine/homoserine/homoserine lactone efflux protein